MPFAWHTNNWDVRPHNRSQALYDRRVGWFCLANLRVIQVYAIQNEILS